VFSDFERDFFKAVLAAIAAVTVANIVTNPQGSVALAKTVFEFPVNLANALRATGNR
jgi:hypothetical protein